MKKIELKNKNKFKKIYNENFKNEDIYHHMVDYKKLVLHKLLKDGERIISLIQNAVDYAIQIESGYGFNISEQICYKIIYKKITNDYCYWLNSTLESNIRFYNEILYFGIVKYFGKKMNIPFYNFRYVQYHQIVKKYYTQSRFEKFTEALFSLDIDIKNEGYKDSVFSFHEGVLRLAINKFEERWSDAIKIACKIVKRDNIKSLVSKNMYSTGVHTADLLYDILILLSKQSIIKCDWKDIISAVEVFSATKLPATGALYNTVYHRLPETDRYGNKIFHNRKVADNVLSVRRVNRIACFKLKHNKIEYLLNELTAKWQEKFNIISSDDSIEAINSVKEYIKLLKEWKTLPKDGWLRVSLKSNQIELLNNDKKMSRFFYELKNKIYGTIKNEDVHSFYSFTNIFFSFYNDKNLLLHILGGCDKQAIHDMGQFKFQIYQRQDFDLFRRINQDRNMLESLDILSKLTNNYRTIRSEFGVCIYECRLQELVKIIESITIEYDNVQDIIVAREASALKLDQDQFEELQEVFSTLKPKESEILPSLKILDGEYKIIKLEHNDIKNLTIGAYVNCCQHIQGAGRECAKHSYTNPMSSVYVLYKGNTIIAQTWAWFDAEKKGICFDNIEALGDTNNIFKYFRILAIELKEYFTRRFKDFSFVSVGTGYSDVDLCGCRPLQANQKLYLRGYNGYSDASTQLMIV